MGPSPEVSRSFRRSSYANGESLLSPCLPKTLGRVVRGLARPHGPHWPVARAQDEH
jgi:hypothetical protein